MGKLVYKFRPNDHDQIGEHESWFAEMASEGLHLKKIGRSLAKFEIGEREETRYRIIFLDTEKAKWVKEQISDLESLGWHLVTDLDEQYIFSSPTYSSAPEIELARPDLIQYMVEYFKRKRKIALISYFFGLLMVFAGLCYLFNDFPVLKIVKSEKIFEALQFPMLITTLIFALWQYNPGWNLKKQYHGIGLVDHQADWRKGRWLRSFLEIVKLMLLFLPLLSMIFLNSNPVAALPGNGKPLPIVRLSDLEQNPDPLHASDDILISSNTYQYRWNPFTTLQIYSTEAGQIPDLLDQETQNPYEPSVHNEYYQLVIPEMAIPLAQEMAKSYHRYDLEPFELSTDARFDCLYLARHEDGISLIVAKESSVLYLHYVGSASIDRILQLVAAKIAAG